MKYNDIKTKDGLAFALGIPIKQLTGLLYGVKIENCYTSFTINKKMEMNEQLMHPIRV